MKQDLFNDLTTAAGSLSVALFFSFMLHSLFLTTKFEYTPSYQTDTKLDIVLVQTKTDKAPKDAKFIGQANQDGGGIDNEEERAKTPVRAPFHSSETNVVTTPFPFQQAMQPQTEHSQHITINDSSFKIKQQQNQNDVNTQSQTIGADLQNTPDMPINESEFVKNTKPTITSRYADFEEKYQEFKNRPNHKFIGIKTKEVIYSNYMNAWIKKVERIAMSQKPPKALKKKLKGNVDVTISFRYDGTLYDIKITEGSKNSVLDDYTLQIARMSVPFKPFDKKILEELGQHGVVNIVRTWKWDTSAYISNNSEETVLTIE